MQDRPQPLGDWINAALEALPADGDRDELEATLTGAYGFDYDEFRTTCAALRSAVEQTNEHEDFDELVERMEQDEPPTEDELYGFLMFGIGFAWAQRRDAEAKRLEEGLQ